MNRITKEGFNRLGFESYKHDPIKEIACDDSDFRYRALDKKGFGWRIEYYHGEKDDLRNSIWIGANYDFKSKKNTVAHTVRFKGVIHKEEDLNNVLKMIGYEKFH